MAIKDYWKPILGAAIVAIIAVVVVVVVMNNKSEGTTKAPVVGTTAPVLVTDVVTENPGKYFYMAYYIINCYRW